MSINCKSIILTVKGKQNCAPCKVGETYIAKAKCVFEGATFENASNNVRFEIDFKENVYANDGFRVDTLNISKLTLLKQFEVINERYGKPESLFNFI